MIKIKLAPGGLVIVDSHAKPSGELEMHSRLQRYHKKTRAVVHLHPTNILAAMYAGWDLQDLAAIDEVGVFFTTPNAIDLVQKSANYITKRLGGNGAVREICDLIISSKGSNSSLEFERFVKKG